MAESCATAAELGSRLRPKVSPRTVAGDLAWLARAFPDQVRSIRGGDARTVLWHLKGLPPVLLPGGITSLTHDELAALIAARGLLRSPENRHPGWERPSTAYAGDLSAALHGLLERLGLGAEARAIAPTTIGVSRFGIAPDPPGSLATIQRALLTGQAVRFSYLNRRGHERPCHAWPIRLVLIKGEWFCFAWAGVESGSGRVKQYALARITSRNPAVTVESALPSGAPTRPPHDEVDASLASGFHATGSADRRDRVRIVLAVGPDAWPSIADRTWGEGQDIQHAPADLPDGWHRLSFSTTGLMEARHWVLGFGASVRAESPAALTEWLCTQAESMLSHMHAIPVAHIDDTITRTNREGSP